MKTTVFSFILAIFMASTSFVSAQTRQENRQIRDLEAEITRLQSQANRLKNQQEDTTYLVALERRVSSSIAALTSDTADPSDVASYQRAQVQLREKQALLTQIRNDRKQASVANQSLQLEINGLYARISQLESSRRAIFDRYATTEDIPRELTQNTMRRRQQSNVVRREELSLEVLKNLPVYGDTVGEVIRFKVIVENNLIFDATFDIVPIDGGLSLPVVVPPNSKETIFLVPGNYMVLCTNNATGKIVGAKAMGVDRMVKIVKGEECHGFTASPRY